MRISTGFFLGAALTLGALAFGGCDDKDSQQSGKPESHSMAKPRSAGSGGSAWMTTNDQHISAWRITRPPTRLAGSQLVSADREPAAPQPGELMPDDPASGIRLAIGANMLPARDSVRAADLVNRALQSADPPSGEAPPSQPTAILISTPWSDDTLLLWVAVPSVMIGDATAISIDFNPKVIANYRPLGDPSDMPAPVAIPGWYGRAAMLYELSPTPDSAQARMGASPIALKYGAIRIAGAASNPPRVERAITAADALGGIDRAPDPVQFAAAVAGFGGLLRGDPALRDLSCNDMIALAEGAALPDPDGWHGKMIALMRRAEPLIDLPPR